jgi:hypothetical protein
VEVRYGDETLGVRIRDNGPGLDTGFAEEAPPGGHGLTGMRERAAAVGGRLRTGPAPGPATLAILPRESNPAVPLMCGAPSSASSAAPRPRPARCLFQVFTKRGAGVNSSVA